MPSLEGKPARHRYTPLRVGDRVRFTEGPKETYVVSGIVHRQGPDWYRLHGHLQDVPRHKLRKVAGKASA
jgi:hypothetical protein